MLWGSMKEVSFGRRSTNADGLRSSVEYHLGDCGSASDHLVGLPAMRHHMDLFHKGGSSRGSGDARDGGLGWDTFPESEQAEQG